MCYTTDVFLASREKDLVFFLYQKLLPQHATHHKALAGDDDAHGASVPPMHQAVSRDAGQLLSEESQPDSTIPPQFVSSLEDTAENASASPADLAGRELQRGQGPGDQASLFLL